ncbi:hypothetical protein, partial [Ruminococcus sp.]
MKEERKLDMLENTEQSVIDRLSSEFPPQDVNEKELIFKMSERKFNKNINGLSDGDEQTVSGVEVYKRPVWQRVLSTAAAVAVLAGGITGTAYALKHFRNVSDTASDIVTEDTTQHDLKKIAPFGDFAELEYQICDFQQETMQPIFIRDTDGIKSVFELYSGPIIDTEKREKIADFFNDFDYEELAMDEDEAVGIVNTFMTDQDSAPQVIIESEENVPQKALIIQSQNMLEAGSPYFIYCRDNEVRAIRFYDVGQYGVLNYTHFHYGEKDGQLVMTDDKISVEGWKIDYDLFKTTIEEILSDTLNEPEEVTTAPEEESMTETETDAGSENDSFLTLYSSFKDQNWVFSDTNSQQIIETSYEQRENIYNIINCSRCSFVSKENFEASDIVSETPKEHITLSSRDEESLYLFDFSLINGKTYAAFGKYDTEKPDYTDSYY